MNIWNPWEIEREIWDEEEETKALDSNPTRPSRLRLARVLKPYSREGKTNSNIINLKLCRMAYKLQDKQYTENKTEDSWTLPN